VGWSGGLFKSTGLTQRLVAAVFGGIIETQVQERMKASSLLDRAAEDIGWRRLTGDDDRDLLPIEQDRMFQICYWLWETNPIAQWVIETIKDFVIADGLPFDSTNEEIKQLLTEFWNDPLNNLKIYFEKHVRENLIFGELCLPAFVAKQTGKVRLGYIDPYLIKEVITDPENVKAVIGVIKKGGPDTPERKYRTILPEGADDILSPAAQALRAGYTDGQCFYFSINNVTNSPRGRSELLIIADWSDAYEQFLYDYADKWPLQNAFVWDMEVQNAQQKELDEQLKNFSKKSGSVFAHNEKVKLEACAPDLKSVDAAEGARLFRNHILGAKGLPEHWYGGGGDVNRATAAEMDKPTMKKLTSRQTYFKYVVESIFDFVILSARNARYLKVADEDARSYTVNAPELDTKDIAKIGTAVQQLAVSVALAQNQGWLDEDSARKIFADGLKLLGIELDLEAIKTALDKAKGTEEYKDYLKKGAGQPDMKDKDLAAAAAGGENADENDG
jgi:hypothetical protein